MSVLKSEIDLLKNLSLAELNERLAQIEKLGKETLAAADGPVVSYRMEKGRQVPVSRKEAALNTQRHAWRVTKAAIEERTKVTYSQCTEHETHKFVIEASDLGWKPGDWPEMISTDMGNKMPFVKAEVKVVDGDLMWMVYRQAAGCISLKVFND